MSKIVLFVVTEDWYFCSHRLKLACGLRDSGLDVRVATRVGNCKEIIEAEGFKLYSLSLRRRTLSPWGEVAAVWQLAKLYRNIRPDVVHHVALKPVIYGTIAAQLSGVRTVVNALAGLGFIYSSKSLRARAFRPVITSALKFLMTRDRVQAIVQNPDDVGVLVRLGVAPGKVHLIQGSGVDLDEFDVTDEPVGPVVVTMVSRMLKDKGVEELVKSAKILKARNIPVVIQLVGLPDRDNPAAVSSEQLQNWHDSGIVRWLGFRDDIAKIWASSHVAVLPSYREGLPKSLLEAAACGRAIVTTDVPGCREIVANEINGLLVPAKDPQALADALERLITNPALRLDYGRNGRARVVREFSDQQVLHDTLSLYQTLLP